MALLGICNPTGEPSWTRTVNIGDYGGDPLKHDSETEGAAPYTFQVYMGLRSMRGSAYSQNTTDLVHVENLALARTIAAIWFRGPEKMRANALPERADERLMYWATVLGVPVRDSDPAWQIRQRCAAHYLAATGPTYDNVVAALQSLLGDAFVDLILTTSPGSNLNDPPDQTYWPGINPGPDSYDLGGGTWLSERNYVLVRVQHPSGMSDAEFQDLIGAQVFRLLDRMLPAWVTFAAAVQDESGGDTGFILDVSRLDLTAFG